MKLTEAASIPSWKVKGKFKDTVAKFRCKYENDKLNHSGSTWTEIETTLVEIYAEIDEKAIAKGDLKVAETLKEQQKKNTEIGFNLCDADPAAFAYDNADSIVASVSSVANPRKKTCRPRNVEEMKTECAVLNNVLRNFGESLKRKNDSDASVEAKKMLSMAREEEKYEQKKIQTE